MINYTKQKRTRPKLERRNAVKNIDYEATDSPSSSSSFNESSTSGTRYLSLLPVPGGKSFRIEGVEGEFDLICRSLGLTVEDFAIPVAAWEASKVSSPSAQLKSCSFGDVVTTADELSDSFAARISVSDELTSVVESSEIDAAAVTVSKTEARVNHANINTDSISGCRIKGLRPPSLAPPPGVSYRAVDDVSSTWDILKAFGPSDDKDFNEFKQDNGMNGRQLVGSLGYAARIVSEYCSDSSNDENDCENDGDCFHAMVEPVCCILPHDSLGRKIDSWQKGHFLGSGSFGKVYEGFTDDGFFFAVKEVSLLDQDSQGKQSILQLEHEISLLSQFRHENIVRYLGTEKDDSKLYIFLELVTKGSLKSLYQTYHLRDSQVCVHKTDSEWAELSS